MSLSVSAINNDAFRREPLPHLSFDVELLGDCDKVVNQLCLMLGGEEWREPIRGDNLTEHTGLPESLISEKQSKDMKEDKEQSVDKETGEDEGLKEIKAAQDRTSDQEKLTEAGAADIRSGELEGVSSTSASEQLANKTNDDKPEKEMSNADSDDDDDEGDDWKVKSLSDYIPSGQYLFFPPSRYVFPGAEVYPDSSDDEDEEEDGLEDEQEEEADKEAEGDHSRPVEDSKELQEEHNDNQNE